MKKIMFNDKYGLTQAVLDGRKTQTRRIITYPKTVNAKEVCTVLYSHDATTGAITGCCCADRRLYKIEGGGILPKYKFGEVVAVAQSYKNCGYAPDALDRSPKDYRIVRGTLGESKGWNNKMFVRADACKNRIRITNVRVERLQDISDEDCLAEGIRVVEVNNNLGNCATHTEYRVTYQDKFSREKVLIGMTPREAYAALIDRISGKDTWESNPFVFVYDFELVKD